MTKADSLVKEQLGKLGEEKEPVTDYRREYTDLRSDLGEKDEYFACYASALALVIIYEACQEAEM